MVTVDDHTAEYWRRARTATAAHCCNHDDPLPDPGEPEHHGGGGFVWHVEHYDIAHASFQIAALLFGPDNGTSKRDDIECQIQKVMMTTFDWNTVRHR
jgi:hypothetical protein